MFDYINGQVKEIQKDSIVLESNNIGYKILSPTPYNYQLEENTKIYTYLKIYSDDGIVNLYGFKESKERELFLKLIGVSGIGPKSALAILATGSVENISQAINNGDCKYLCKFPGIGSKSAQQIILDLKGKLDIKSDYSGNYIVLDEVRDALQVLGYSDKDINKVLPQLDSNKPTSDLIVDALAKILK